MGSPPIPDRPRPLPPPAARPSVSPSSVPFSPPKRKSGGSLKAKERAMDLDDGSATAATAGANGKGTVTYRHLLGNNNTGAARSFREPIQSGADQSEDDSNPLRVVAHIDIDAAYAAMEMARLGIPEDQPMAVQQWNGLIAVNYPARRYGITRHETPADAIKKCPELRLVHVQTYKNGETEPGYWDGAKPETHKVSLDMYRKESRRILAVFSEFCPIVEKASIDESFLDLTLPVRQALLSRFPALRAPPPDAPLGLDTPLPPPSELGATTVDWEQLGNLVPMSGQKQPKVRKLDALGNDVLSSSPSKPVPSTSSNPPPFAEDDATPDTLEPPLTWSDLSLSLGAAIVRTTRAAVRDRLGYTCSAGIAPNKMLAKLCSAWRKPDAQTVLRHCAVPAFLKPMPFQKIRNLGGKLGNAVKEAYEVETVEDLLKFSLAELQTKLGNDSGMWLWEIARGIDFSEVEAKTQVKSMLSSKNFRPTISKYSEVLHWINILATELHLRLSDAREASPGLWPKTITFTHRSAAYVVRSHQSAFPFTSALSIAYIFRAAEKLLRTATGADKAPASFGPETSVGPYSNIQLSFSGLERLEEGQKGIDGFFGAHAKGAGEGKGKGKGSEERAKVEDKGDDAAGSATNKKVKLDHTSASTSTVPTPTSSKRARIAAPRSPPRSPPRAHPVPTARHSPLSELPNMYPLP
ncbi:SPOSA6832_04423 [Sporobolomyces salmonicolor]|uniref:DNA polymerase eta n=1 Tax=Sporidiobolus salmonicolor TaxID=5005 RepID=A0A0D6ERX3_SPOSA|nr:SPOSA6832_04423 [Sporobolomyces salmonicolor]